MKTNAIAADQTLSPPYQISADNRAQIDGEDEIRRDWLRLWYALFTFQDRIGNGFDFVRRPFLMDIYKDDAQFIVIKKASQVGITEWALAEMYSKAERGHNGMYVLPTDKIVYDFTPRRIDRMIRQSEHLRALIPQKKKHSDTKSQKTFFGRDWSLVGSNSVTNFYEKPVDVIIIDEKDKCNADNLSYAFDRLGAAPREYIRILGNPTTAGFGIDEDFQTTDQSHWHIKCQHCNEWQELDWYANVVREDDKTHTWIARHDDGLAYDISAVCQHCQKPVDRLGAGKWIALFPERERHGYHVNRIFGDSRDGQRLREMLKTFNAAQGNQTEMQRFANNVLGVVYEESGAKITESMLQNCVDENWAMPEVAEGIIGGIDVGAYLHIKLDQLIDGVRKAVFVGKVRTFEQAEDIIRKYKCHMGVIDALPETHKTREFVKRNSGWFMCYYNKAADAKKFIVPNPDDRSISVNKTETLDASHQTVKMRKMVLPKHWRQIDGGDFMRQMCAPTRVFDEKRGVFVWTEKGAPDHYRHADNYVEIAKRLYRGEVQIVWLN